MTDPQKIQKVLNQVWRGVLMTPCVYSQAALAHTVGVTPCGHHWVINSRHHMHGESVIEAIRLILQAMMV
jgi:hypothetical protein